MKKQLRTISGVGLSVITPFAVAHSGHDHGHWLSEPIHLLSIGAVLAVSAAGVVVYKRNKSAQKIDK